MWSFWFGLMMGGCVNLFCVGYVLIRGLMR